MNPVIVATTPSSGLDGGAKTDVIGGGPVVVAVAVVALACVPNVYLFHENNVRVAYNLIWPLRHFRIIGTMSSFQDACLVENFGIWIDAFNNFANSFT